MTLDSQSEYLSRSGCDLRKRVGPILASEIRDLDLEDQSFLRNQNIPARASPTWRYRHNVILGIKVLIGPVLS